VVNPNRFILHPLDTLKNFTEFSIPVGSKACFTFLIN
jgi:hypothetical protein